MGSRVYFYACCCNFYSLWYAFFMNISTLMKKNTATAKAQKDIARILDKYDVTLPELLGVADTKKDNDETLWHSFRSVYEQAQEELFAKTYPALWKKSQRKQ